MIKVILPDEENPLEQISASLKIIDEMEKIFNKREKVELDLSEISWILPCSALLLAEKIKELENKGVKIDYILPKNDKVKKYLLDIGFPLGSKDEGNTFVPINHFSNNPEDKHQINTETNNLLDKIKKKIPNQFGQSILYILGELADNVDQHSNFSFASIMSQYYPRKDYVDIGVLDNGVTIPYLFENNKVIFSKDSEAIRKALWGEVTTKEGETRGYGLKSCRNLAEEMEGEVHVVSRKGILILKSGKEPLCKDFLNTSLKGTLLYFRLKTPSKKIDIYKVIEK
jgi:hypothetical protein